MVTFQQLQQESPALSKQQARRDAKLSFRQLARQQQRSAPVKHIQGDHGLDESRKAVYEQALLYVSGVLAAVRRQNRFSLEPGFNIVKEMAKVHHTRDYLFVMAIHSNGRFDYVIHHSVNVAVYAVKMAQSLGLSSVQQIEIGMAGLLHDVGMGLVPQAIIDKKEQLTAEETAILQQRPNHSYEILRALGQDFAYLAECALQVYERIDGTGYPQGLKGDEIHQYAQIVGLLDTYEALIQPRPQRQPVPHFSAVKEIFTNRKDQFERAYLKELLNVFTVFPIFSYVRLNSGAVGKVIETYPQQPLRPKIQIVYDSQKRPVFTERIVSLPENPLLNIVDSVPESDLPDLAKT